MDSPEVVDHQAEVDQVVDGDNFMLLYQNMKTYILDVRSLEEYKSGHIENAINLPVDELFDRSEYALDILKKIDKENDQIKVYCASGARAAIVKSILEFMQYKNVVNLGGVS